MGDFWCAIDIWGRTLLHWVMFDLESFQAVPNGKSRISITLGELCLMNLSIRKFSTPFYRSFITTCLAIVFSSFTNNCALSWDVSVSVEDFDQDFLVDSSSGSFTWTTLSEGLRADSGTGSSLPNDNITQAWDGSAWPSDTMSDTESAAGISADAEIDHLSVAEEFFSTAGAFVFGDIPPDTSYGAAWFYNFELTLDPGAMANVLLDPGSASAYLESEAGDDGNAFADVRLYSTDVGLNDPGGVNNPYDIDSLSLASPPTGAIVDSLLGLSYTFSNSGPTPITYTLRLQGRVIVFENSIIPEPTSLVLFGLGGLGLLLVRRDSNESRK